VSPGATAVLPTPSADFERLVASIPDVLFRLDLDLRHLFISPNIETLAGLAPQSFIGKTGREVGLASAACDILEAGARRALEGTSTMVQFSVRGRTFRTRLIPEQDANGLVASVRGIAEDITEATKTDDALRDRDAELRALIEPWAQAHWETNAEGMVVLDSPSWRAYTGQTFEEWRGDGWANAVHPDDRTNAARRWAEAMAGSLPVSQEFRLRRAGGGWRWTNVRASPVFGPDGVVRKWVGINIDISDRKHDEQRLRDSREQLRRLAAKLQSIREEEKARIARDLHDELGQLLTALKMKVRAIESAVGGLPASDATNPVLDRAVAASELVDEAVASLQRTALDLRPGALDRIGLDAALRDEARRFAAHSQVQCEVLVPDEMPEVPPEVATALYRICQEALTNVLRHADASRVALRLEIGADAITLRVEDNGRGLEPSMIESPLGLGLLGMTERARAVGGGVTFERSSTCGGTAVVAHAPLRYGASSL
jgi:two-component system, chemotaxis family, CheB/CheR fusion protein